MCACTRPEMLGAFLIVCNGELEIQGEERPEDCEQVILELRILHRRAEVCVSVKRGLSCGNRA